MSEQKKQECIVYLETYEKYASGIYSAYVDFRQSKDMELFADVTGNKSLNASILELRSLKASKRLIKGCYYKLNLELLKEFPIEYVEDSYIIGAVYNLENMCMPENNSKAMLQSHKPLNASVMSMVNVPLSFAGVELFKENEELINSRNLRLYVKNVGQANWNELQCDNEIVVLYDAGAELHAKKTEIDLILNSRNQDLAKSKPVLVISHWDMDHIHCLKGMSGCGIKNYFSKVVCPDKMMSKTSKDILNSIKQALGKRNVFCLPLPKASKGIKKMHLWKREGPVALYQGDKRSNINECGLVMFVKGKSYSVNFTADCSLEQAKYVYDQENNELLKHILIAPHHGGDAAPKKSPNYSIPCDKIEISVGRNNQYGHPANKMLKYYKSLGLVKRTDSNGDIVENL